MTHVVEPYDHGTHVARLVSWLGKHNITVPDRRLFSDCGLVVNNTAIGFLFKTNSRQAYIDHVAADPLATKEKRDVSLTILFDSLEKIAMENGVLMVTALAQLPAMKHRFEYHGYKAFGNFSLYYKTLPGGI